MLNRETASVWQVSVDAEQQHSGRPEASRASGHTVASVLTNRAADPMLRDPEYRLVCRSAPPQAVERYGAGHQIHLGADQAVGPVRVDVEPPAQHLRRARTVGPP